MQVRLCADPTRALFAAGLFVRLRAGKREFVRRVGLGPGAWRKYLAE